MTEAAIVPKARLVEIIGERPQLKHVVPIDTFRIVRLTAMSIFFLVYVWYLRNVGLPIDRITVAFSLFLFLVCAFIGKPLWSWALLVADVVAYAAMWFAYEMTRGYADHFGFPRQLDVMRNIDRFLFFGNDPNVVLQRHLISAPGGRFQMQWYHWIFSTAYYSHFVFPVIVMAALWAVSHRQWLRFMKRFATLLFVGCLMFVFLPTIPPWMAGDPKRGFNVLPPLRRDTWRGFYDLGFRGVVKSWQKALDWGNEIAAMPSLHASFALITVAFFLPWIRPRWLKALLVTWPVIMLTALVVYGEHWIIDGIVGWIIVGASFWVWNRIERAVRRSKARRARQAIGALAAARPTHPADPQAVLA